MSIATRITWQSEILAHYRISLDHLSTHRVTGKYNLLQVGEVVLVPKPLENLIEDVERRDARLCRRIYVGYALEPEVV